MLLPQLSLSTNLWLEAVDEGVFGRLESEKSVEEDIFSLRKSMVVEVVEGDVNELVE